MTNVYRDICIKLLACTDKTGRIINIRLTKCVSVYEKTL